MQGTPAQRQTQIGHDSQAIEERAESLRPLLAKMDEIEGTRSSLNAQVEEIRGRMDAMGLNRHAVKAARQAGKLTEKKLKGFDVTYHLARLAIDLPVQAELDLSEIAPPAPDKGNGTDADQQQAPWPS